MSILQPKGTFKTAGSKFITYGGVFFWCRCEFNRWTKVVFPDPAIPMQMIVAGMLCVFGLWLFESFISPSFLSLFPILSDISKNKKFMLKKKRPKKILQIT